MSRWIPIQGQWILHGEVIASNQSIPTSCGFEPLPMHALDHVRNQVSHSPPFFSFYCSDDLSWLGLLRNQEDPRNTCPLERTEFSWVGGGRNAPFFMGSDA